MKKPDFNEWIKTEEGLKCCDMATLTSDEYLKNRLFWAFDAGRDCVWQQYLDMKKENESLKAKAAKWDTLGKHMAKHYAEDSDADLIVIGETAAEAFGYL